jgi:hypothetical protein
LLLYVHYGKIFLLNLQQVRTDSMCKEVK